jgi:predicted Zn-dependent protease
MMNVQRKLACTLILSMSALTLMLTVGCAQNRAPSARFLKQAEQLHNTALSSTITPDDDLNDYVHEIGKRLEDAAREVAPDKARGPFFQTMRFHLVDSPVINVFTTGGSHIYVYRGLFEFCRSEEELAAAIAHVYAHALNLDTETTGMVPAEEAPPARQLVWDYVVNRFGAQHEEESDKLAFRLYARAGWDPARFEVLFGRLSDEYPGPPAADRMPLAERGSLARSMVAEVPKKWRQLPVADARTYESLRKHAASLRFTSAAGTSDNKEALLYLVAFPNCILSHDLPQQIQAQELLRPPPPPQTTVEPN